MVAASLRAVASRPSDALAELRAEFADYRATTDARIAQTDARIAQLEAIESARRRPTLARGDRDVLARLVPALGGLYGSSAWLASEAVQHPGLAVLIGGWKSVRLGKLLRRLIASGGVLDGYLVEAIGREGNAVLWHVLKVLEDGTSGTSNTPTIRRGAGPSSIAL